MAGRGFDLLPPTNTVEDGDYLLIQNGLTSKKVSYDNFPSFKEDSEIIEITTGQIVVSGSKVVSNRSLYLIRGGQTLPYKQLIAGIDYTVTGTNQITLSQPSAIPQYVLSLKPADASVGGAVPWEAALVNDVFGFQQSILSASGAIPSGTPDRVGASQYLEALKKVPYISQGSTSARSIPDRLYDIVNVKDFGAVGDGSTDDTVAIQAAIDAVAGTNRILSFAGGEYKVTETLSVGDSNTHINFAFARINVPTGFAGDEVFRVGFAAGGAYIIDGSFINLELHFEDDTQDIDVFYPERAARWIYRDLSIHNLVGTVFNENAIGHEVTGENIYVSSADVPNGTGIHINFSDSYFTNLKPIGFSEFGIVNDGADNRYYGCHPWSYPRSQQGFSNFTTKILFWDKEDGMWDSCYADTWEREDSDQPPSFANGGIAYYFSKVSGIGRMVNCGFYALDTSPDSLIGVATNAGPQQMNCSNCYVLGGSTNYLKFVDVPSSAVAVNLVGCNFSEDEYQAKEQNSGSAFLSNNEFYIKNRDNTEFNSLQTKLRTFAPRRSSHGLIAFEDNGTQHRMFMWDKYFGAQGSLVEVFTSANAIKVYRTLSQLGLDDADYAGMTPDDFFGDVIAAVTARGGFPARLELDGNNVDTPNLVSIGVFPGSGYSYEGKLLSAGRFTMQSQSYAVNRLYTGFYSTTFSGWAQLQTV